MVDFLYGFLFFNCELCSNSCDLFYYYKDWFYLDRVIGNVGSRQGNWNQQVGIFRGFWSQSGIVDGEGWKIIDFYIVFVFDYCFVIFVDDYVIIIVGVYGVGGQFDRILNDFIFQVVMFGYDCFFNYMVGFVYVYLMGEIFVIGKFIFGLVLGVQVVLYVFGNFGIGSQEVV